jgi:WD40 repeat protein
MEILDFEMEIGDLAGRGYPVTARAPAGEASASMRLPLTREELDRQLAVINNAVLASSVITRRVAFFHSGPVRAVAFSPDGRRLATASGNAAEVWILGGRRPR